MKKVTWIALIVIVGFYPVFWSYLVFGPMLFFAESEEPPYNITWDGIAFLAVFWAVPILIAAVFFWYVLRDARKSARAKIVEACPLSDEERRAEG